MRLLHAPLAWDVRFNSFIKPELVLKFEKHMSAALAAFMKLVQRRHSSDSVEAHRGKENACLSFVLRCN